MPQPTARSARPLIGISGRRWSGDRVTGFPASFKQLDVDIHLAAYARAVAIAGGVPVQIGVDTPAEVVDRLDGLVMSGGADVDPGHYGAAPAPELESIEPERDTAELGFIRAALQAAVPMLAICRGQQLLNVVLGGTLSQHLGSSPIDHAAWADPVDTLVHMVQCTPGTIAHRLYGATHAVNSLHHQGIDKLASPLVASATAVDDGVIESVELPGHDVFGVQWHPELLDQPDPAFRWLIEAAARFDGSRRGDSAVSR